MADRPLELFPVAIGAYDHHPALDADAEVRRVADLLADFGAAPREWAVPAAGRGGDAVSARLADWSSRTEGDTVLYWVGHGWSDGDRAALAHARSPLAVDASGVSPEQLAAALAAREGAAEDDGWSVVIIDACRSDVFAKRLNDAIDRRGNPARVLVVGVSDAGSTTLGVFADRLAQVLGKIFGANSEIELWDLGKELQRVLPPGAAVRVLNVGDAALVRRVPAVSGAPLDVLAELSAVLADLTDDERQHFLPKAQGAELGEVAWYFEGRRTELEQIATWLRTAETGLLVVTGRPGAGKSALLGQVVAHSRPRLREALVQHGLSEPLPPEATPPDDCFDLVLNLTGLLVYDVASRLLVLPKSVTPPPNDGFLANYSDRDKVLSALALTGIQNLPEPPTLLLDGLDESADPIKLAQFIAALARVARVVVGGRASVQEGPDQPASDNRELLDALGEVDLVTVEEEPEAVGAYVRRRLAAHGAVDDQGAADALVASRRGFLFARLAVHELLSWPGNRLPLIETFEFLNHRDLFTLAVQRLSRKRPAYLPLLGALAVARGRGLPMADGVWEAVASALGVVVTADIDDLLNDGSAYVMRDLDGGRTVYRLAHRTFAEHFGPDDPGPHLMVLRRLLDAPPSPYIERHLSGHAAAAGTNGWRSLALRSDVLDRLDPDAVAADALRSASAGAVLPPDVAGMVGIPVLLSDADSADRPGLRQLAAARHISFYRTRPQAAGSWYVRWALMEQEAIRGRLRVAQDLDPQSLSVFNDRDDRLLLGMGTRNGQIQVWDPVNGVQIGQTICGSAGSAHTTAVMTSPDGEPWIVAGGGSVRVWDLRKGLLLATMPGHYGRIEAMVTFRAANGMALIATGATDEAIRFWDPAAGIQVSVLRGHRGPIRCLTVSTAENGEPRLISGGADGSVRIWDLQTYQQVGTPIYGHAGPITGVVSFAGPDGAPLLAVTAGDSGIRVWDLQSGQKLSGPFAAESGGREIPRIASFSDEFGNSLLAVGGQDGKVRVWDPITAEVSGSPIGAHSVAVHGLLGMPLANRRSLLASLTAAGEITIWEPNSRWSADVSANGNPAAALTTMENRPALAYASGGYVAVRDIVTGELLGPSARAVIGSAITLSSFGPNERRRLIVAGSSGVLVLDQSTEQPTSWKAGSVTAAAGIMGPDGRALVAHGSYNGIVDLWDPLSGMNVDRISGFQGTILAVVPISVRGHSVIAIISTQDTAVQMCVPEDYDAGELFGGIASDVLTHLKSFEGDHGDPFLLTASASGSIQVWSPATGEVAANLQFDAHSIQAVAGFYRPHDRLTVAVASGEGHIEFWDAADGYRVARIETNLHIVDLVTVDQTGMAVVAVDGLAVLDFSGVLADAVPD